jgi:transcriptional regulator with XRE-family HTH domain
MWCRSLDPAAPVKSLHTERYKRLIALLIEARRAASLTQAELATKLGKPQSYVSKVENHERRIDVIEFLEICEALGTGPSEVLVAI